MSSKSRPAKAESKKLTVKSLKIFTGVKAGTLGDEAVSELTGKKKMIMPKDTG